MLRIHKIRFLKAYLYKVFYTHKSPFNGISLRPPQPLRRLFVFYMIQNGLRAVLINLCKIDFRYEKGSWRSFTRVSYAESPLSVCPSTSLVSTPLSVWKKTNESKKRRSNTFCRSESPYNQTCVQRPPWPRDLK